MKFTHPTHMDHVDWEKIYRQRDYGYETIEWRIT